MKVKNIILRVIPALAALIAITSCSKEVEIGGSGSVGGDNVEATLTLQIPAGGFKPAGSRALSPGDENTISEVDVLVFRKENAGAADNTAVFFHRAQTTLVNEAGTDGVGNARRSFRITVKKSDKPLQFVVLANCHDLVEAAVTGFTEETTLRADAMNALVMTAASAWNTATDAYDPLPMWGQTAFRTITDASSAAATIDMIRAQARIDVTVNATAKNDFKLSDIRLYNPSTKGLVAPQSWTGGTVSLPTSRDAAASPFVYSAMTTADEALVGMIYTFEAPAATGSTDSSAPYLVVGGSWNGEAVSYYRVDFATTENNVTTFMPLLRNYHYEVDIISVEGRGYSSPAQAAANGFTGLTAKVHQWAQGQMGTVVWDGQNWLAVSDTEFNIYPEARSISLQAATTFAEGWKATVALDGNDETDWLTIDGSDTGAGNATNPPVGTLKFNVTDNLTSTPSRTAVITISAGRLRQRVTVVQSITKELSLELGEVQMVFSAANPVAIPLHVEWKPGALACAVATTNAPNGVDGTVYSVLQFTGANALQPVSDPSQEGAVNYSIKPDAFTVSSSDPFQEKRSTLTVTANDGVLPTPNTISKTVLLRQFDYAIRVTGMQAGNFYQQLALYSLAVRCNEEWEMEVYDPDNVLVSITTPIGEPNVTAAGETVTFRMADKTKAGKAATLTFKSKASPALFPEQVVTITMRSNEPNSYIVPPVSGKNTVTIPVSKVFRIWKDDVDLNGSRAGDDLAMTSASGYTVELLWQDEAGLITSAGTLSSQNSDGTFTVTANTSGVQGNAVVVLKENGVIRWSWHIWVCDFDPDQNTGYNSRNGLVIMDRDLGATNSTLGDIGSYGMYYQWGRLTPFPKASGLTGNTFKTIYGPGGVTTIQNVDMITFAGNLSYRNLANALENPSTFFYNTRNASISNSYWDWYSPTLRNQVPAETVIRRLDLWDTYKTAYDPCPEGWKVPDKLRFEYVPPGNYVAGEGAVLYDMTGNFLGTFPLSGCINIHGSFGNVGFRWYGWYTSINYVETISASSILLSAIANVYGFPVRCVKVE